MDSSNPKGISVAKDLLSLPPTPPNSVPMRVDMEVDHSPPGAVNKNRRVPMVRPGPGTRGENITLLTNHLQVKVDSRGVLFRYSVEIYYEDGKPVDHVKGIGRKIMDTVKETYNTELGRVNFVYDGEKSLYTEDLFPSCIHKFSVVLDSISSYRSDGNSSTSPGCPNENDQKRQRQPDQAKSFNVVICGDSKISLLPISLISHGFYSKKLSEKYQNALTLLNVSLKQHSADKGCLLVGQSFFYNSPTNFYSIGGGVLGFRGFHSSLRTSQGGLFLNIDVSNTMIVQPGLVLDFLLFNQNVKCPSLIDWPKAKRSLKNLRIKVDSSNAEYKITGLSEKPCNEQMFFFKTRGNTDDGGNQTVEISVYDYFKIHRNIELFSSAELPCINVGKQKRPIYIPLELCSLVSLQHYTKALTTSQRSSLMEKSRSNPQERLSVLSNAVKTQNFAAEPMLRSNSVSINSDFARIDGRVLKPPKLKFGNGEENFPRYGRWNLINKKLVEPVTITQWAVVNFSANWGKFLRLDNFLTLGKRMGMIIDNPCYLFDEEPNMDRRAPPLVRVEIMIETIKSIFPKGLNFILCLLPAKMNCEIYGLWKKKTLFELGTVNQCLLMSSSRMADDQYLYNLLLKINAKLGGLNSMLALEHSLSVPRVSNVPTMIIGMDVSHGSPGYSDVPSVAAVVSSRKWPSISRYKASVRTQLPKTEMIDSLFKPVSDREDEGMFRELLMDFYASSEKRKPDQIIVFRDGVSESQFNQVLNFELDQMIEACKFLDETWSPKFVVIVAQKNHHTRFFQSNSPENVPPGTVIDSVVCHPRNNDFYMCAHAGLIGTTRPTHYHVLFDEIGFSADELQELVHSLSYVYQRSTTAISVAAPIAYAHLAAAQVATFVKLEEISETLPSKEGSTCTGAVPVPQLPRPLENIANSMFFC